MMLRDTRAPQSHQHAPLPSPAADADSSATANTTAAPDDDWETQDPSAHTLPPNPTTTTTSTMSVDTATHAFDQMRIMQPAPALVQDGGAYERVLAGAQPVSAATASAASAHALDGGRGPVDPVLVACLDNARERLTLLKFEDQIVRFMKNPREAQLVFPPLSSYHRLIIHRLAERCCLEHQTAEYNPYAPQPGGYDGNSPRAVTLFKTSQSVVPSVLLIDLSANRQQQATAAPASVPKIMVRKRAGPRPGANAGRGPADAKNTQRSMQDRERAYAEARARIFGEDNSGDAASSSASSTGSSASTNAPAASKLNSNSQQAAGPDGSRGFGGRGRGRGSAPAERSPHRPQQEASTELTRTDTSGASESAAPAVRAQSTHNWKESKVLWRNREQELNDPDFTRHRDAYRPSRNAHADGYSRYPASQTGRFNGPAPPMEFYDSAAARQQQQLNYQQQPPLPGRRFAPNDFHRLDATGTGNSTTMRPPPPPDHFRTASGGGGRYPAVPTNPPMPPPPMARGYGYASQQQQPARPLYQSSPSPVRSGGYNDDFPPLGK